MVERAPGAGTHTGRNLGSSVGLAKAEQSEQNSAGGKTLLDESLSIQLSEVVRGLVHWFYRW